jgi:hypothetical protein
MARRTPRLLAAAAALLGSSVLLQGCFLVGPQGSGILGSPEDFQADRDVRTAQANVRSAIPAAEAYYADHSSYVGMSVAGLQAIDMGIPPGLVVAGVTPTTYCLEFTEGAATASYEGPGGTVLDQPCP